MEREKSRQRRHFRPIADSAQVPRVSQRDDRYSVPARFLDPDPNSTHMGETQEERILQFLEENDTPVAGLREGAIVWADNGSYILKGSSGARIFRKGVEPVETLPGDCLDDLVNRKPML